MKSQSLLKPPQSQRLKSGKVILTPGEEVGEHVTEKREELLIILKGQATLLISDEKFVLNAGETKYIPENTLHNVLNNSDQTLEYIYVVALLD